jgi:hypothetical protein
MKSIQLAFVAGLLLIASCKKEDKGSASDTIGGDGNLATNAVGYKYSCYTNAPGVTASQVVVTNSDNSGLVTLNITGAIPTVGTALTNLIPASYKDAAGNLNVTGKFKNTSEGILDYTNSDSKPFVLVNYSSNVGDKYVLHKSNGQTITRTVTAKSTTDDYPYGMLMIKTMTVEQDSRISGISKIRYYANHKFGLVGIEFVMEDGTVTKLSIM